MAAASVIEPGQALASKFVIVRCANKCTPCGHQDYLNSPVPAPLLVHHTAPLYIFLLPLGSYSCGVMRMALLSSSESTARDKMAKSPRRALSTKTIPSFGVFRVLTLYSKHLWARTELAVFPQCDIDHTHTDKMSNWRPNSVIRPPHMLPYLQSSFFKL